MGAPNFDITPGQAGGASSLPALAAYLRGSCGHLALSDRILQQGYRFYASFSDELPRFFNKRLTTGDQGLSVTLQGGISLDGDDPFAECSTHAHVQATLTEPGTPQTFWVARASVGNHLHHVSEIAAPDFIAKHPAEFMTLADELLSLELATRSSCQLCADDD